MEENFNNEHEHKKECHTPTCWLKYLVITLAAFFGAFLAVYFVADNTMHRYMYPQLPPTMPDRQIQQAINQQERMMRDITDFSMPINPFAQNPVQVESMKDGDAYKIIIDLKPFNNNPNNIKLNINENSVKISGNSDTKKHHREKDISFMQNFSLPQKINVHDVTKEIKHNKYIITLPIED
ncbi:MAG: Hsp20/alpha crystallin family protein [Candidatus Gastranaerophilales bacterium]|nr:Hsp20/alpha crystallin family protein [Candidatus Gastranaerophilales bacterium]